MTHPATPIDIRGLDHVVLRVKELDAALRFYRDALGLPIERELAAGLVQLRAGAALIDLVPVDSALGRLGGPPPGSVGRNMDHFALELASFDPPAIFAHLDGCGIAHGTVEQRYGANGTGPSIYITDPDGNTVELKGPPTDRPRSVV